MGKGFWICPRCGARNPRGIPRCLHCGWPEDWWRARPPRLRA